MYRGKKQKQNTPWGNEQISISNKSTILWQSQDEIVLTPQQSVVREIFIQTISKHKNIFIKQCTHRRHNLRDDRTIFLSTIPYIPQILVWSKMGMNAVNAVLQLSIASGKPSDIQYSPLGRGPHPELLTPPQLLQDDRSLPALTVSISKTCFSCQTP